MTTTIDAAQLVKRAFPPEEGAALARSLLSNPQVDWDDLELDLTALPASLLISAFFNGFLQAIFNARPELLAKARLVKWQLKFPFQDENVADWMQKFEPNTSA